MLVKELYIKNPVAKRGEVLKDLELKDSKKIEGFVEIKLLDEKKAMYEDSVFFLNRNSIFKIVTELLK